MNLEQLSTQIANVHDVLYKKATSAVNVSLTLRNWFIRYYIVEYEQHGEDRAKYGEKILKTLSKNLKSKGLSNISDGELRKFRQFYKIYNYFTQTLFDKNSQIRGTLPRIFTDLHICGTPHRESSKSDFIIPPDKIISRLSFSHFEELNKIENPLKRAFYEVECINGVWSTRELERQINSLYYERCGLSLDKEKLSELANKNAETIQPVDIIKNPLTFEFLGLPLNILLEEDQLEKALIDNLEQFLLKLGNGFCFEARQKRILIDNEYFYIDLVFYHRILKCHVLVEIKTEKFSHENLGQLNAYLQYYKHEVMQQTDNPPVGILLCTKSKPQMVKYATAADERLFVTEYKLNLPSEEEIQQYIESKINANSLK